MKNWTKHIPTKNLKKLAGNNPGSGTSYNALSYQDVVKELRRRKA